MAVGGAREIRDLSGPRTEVVDLRGRALLPGFQDAHVHPAFAGVTMMRCDLAGAGDAAGRSPGSRPTPGSIPARSGSRAAAGAWSGSRAGRPAANCWTAWPDRGPPTSPTGTGTAPGPIPAPSNWPGWTRARRIPPDGRIERDAGGSPQGTLHEGAAILVGRLVPAPGAGDSLTGLLRAQQHLHRLGITAWQDAIVGDYLGHADPLPVYLAAAAAGQLTARVEGALWWDRGRGAEQLDDLLSRRELAARAAAAGPPGPADRFRSNTVKIMQDGVAENFTAGMIDPYLDGCGGQTANLGLSYVDPQELREHVTRLDAEGFGVHFHAIGDRAVREALDAVAAARAANGATPGRHHIAHLQVVHGDDIPRFTELGVTANMQALWATHEPQMDELTIPFLGPERSARQYPFGDLLRSGARLAAGSDWAVISANPLWGIHVAVNRTLPPGQGDPGAGPLLPGQALSLGQALAAYTAGSAYVNNLDQAGAIGPGRLADLIVLDRDPFTGPPTAIGATTVLLTYVGGQRVYSAESA